MRLLMTLLTALLLAGCGGGPAEGRRLDDRESFLADYRGKTAADLPELLKALAAPQEAARAQAAHFLGQMGADAVPALPALERALADPVAEVRLAAALALGELGPAAAPALPALRRLSAGGNPDTRRLAEAAIGKIEVNQGDAS